MAVGSDLHYTRDSGTPRETLCERRLLRLLGFDRSRSLSLLIGVESREPEELAGLEVGKLWREQFGAGGDADRGFVASLVLRVASGGEHLAVCQQRERVTVTRDAHAACRG